MNRFLVALSFLVMVVSCATSTEYYQKLSASRVGCMPKDVKLSDMDKGLVNQSWVATCKGEKHYCQSSPDSDSSFKVNCSKLK